MRGLRSNDKRGKRVAMKITPQKIYEMYWDAIFEDMIARMEQHEERLKEIFGKLV